MAVETGAGKVGGDAKADEALGEKPYPSRAAELYRTVAQGYSGFVHGASPHIMELYGGNPPRFHTAGMLGTPRMGEYLRDLWNYVYRTLVSHSLVAKAQGLEELDQEIMEYTEEFVRRSQKPYLQADLKRS